MSRSPTVFYRCTVCGQIFDADRVYDRGGGKMICHGCYAAQPQTERTVEPGLHEISAATAATQTSAPATSPAKHTPARGSSKLVPRLIAGAFTVVIVGAVVFIVVPKLKQPAASTEVASRSAAPPKPVPTTKSGESNVARVNRLWQEARRQTSENNHADAARLYEEMFSIVDNDPAIARNQKLKATVAPARKEWTLASEAAERAANEVATKTTTTPPQEPTPTPSPDDAPSPSPQAQAPSEEPSPTQSGQTTKQPKALAPPSTPAQIAALLDSADKIAAAGDKATALKRYSDALAAAGDQSGIVDAALRKRLTQALHKRAALIGQLRGGDALRRMSLTALMDQGEQALKSGKWEAGLGSLADARTLVEQRTKVAAERVSDPHYLPALHGMAVAYLQLKKNAKAAELFDDKAPLGRAATAAAPAPPPGRAMVWNLAVMDMIQKHRVMRAVKSLLEYYNKHPEDDDEKLHNMFGTAIAIGYEKFAEDDKPPALLAQAITLYKKQDQALEARRGGQKRWGVRWVPSGEYTRLTQQRNDAQARIRSIERGELAQAQRRLQEVSRPRGAGADRNQQERDKEAAKNRIRAARASMKEEWEKAPQPPWLTAYEPIVPPLTPRTSSPPPAARPTVAVATADETPPEKPAPAIPLREPTRVEPEPVAMTETEAEPAPEPAPTRRAVQRYAAAFPIDRLRLITAAGPVGQAATVSLQDGQGAMMQGRVVARSDRLALIEVDAQDVNGGMRFLNLAKDFAGGPVNCVGLPSPNVFLPIPETIDGRAPRPPDGDATGAGGWSVGLSRHPRLAGAPVLNGADNTLVGIVLAERDDPPTQLPAASADALRAFLTEHNALPPGRCANPDPTAVYQVNITE